MVLILRGGGGVKPVTTWLDMRHAVVEGGKGGRAKKSCRQLGSELTQLESKLVA